ncbi:VOC family protein [Dyella tabacisoli]|uniref:VOC family protein n=1 Tax=Dyella tabacisoli TaxID=2282381 RepID=A0A369UJU8_9GAMM|nr:VOC family protein [Dyella tabacisoli]
MNPIITNWFEIPVREMDRAMHFYQTALQTKLRHEPMGGMELAIFPYDEATHVTGSLLKMEHCEPSMQGSTVYLSVDDVATALTRIEAAGGSVIVPRTVLPEGRGCFAQFGDSEGNRVGLWAKQ